MPITYYLQPNPITPDPNDQMARVQANQVLGVDDIVKRVTKRGTTVNEADVRSVLLLAFEEIADAVAEGNSVNTDLVNIRPSIQGVFTNAADSFDPSRHTTRASITSGNFLYKVMSEAKVQKTDNITAAPNIIDFHDVATNSNTQATKGSIGTIVGSDLKYNDANALEGIFFIAANNTETKVTVVAQRTEGKLMFSIPASLVAGNYFVEVRRAYTAANTIRTGRFEQVLQVS